MTAQEMWMLFVGQKSIDPNTPYTAWHFCNNEADADELAELVFTGVKKATASCLWYYEHSEEALPQIGDYSIILDWQGCAKGIIQTTAVDIVPFCLVSEEFAAIEGEGDKSLAYWRKAHISYFTEECEKLGKQFVETMPVVCEQFTIVFQLPIVG